MSAANRYFIHIMEDGIHIVSRRRYMNSKENINLKDAALKGVPFKADWLLKMAGKSLKQCLRKGMETRNPIILYVDSQEEEMTKITPKEFIKRLTPMGERTLSTKKELMNELKEDIKLTSQELSYKYSISLDFPESLSEGDKLDILLKYICLRMLRYNRCDHPNDIESNRTLNELLS